MRYLAEPGSHECRKWGTGARASWRAVYGDTAYSVTVFLIPYATFGLVSGVCDQNAKGVGESEHVLFWIHTPLYPHQSSVLILDRGAGGPVL